VGSQTVADAALVEAAGLAVMQLGIPTYLSGMARGLLGRHHPLVFRHGRRDALRTADLVILAGVPCDFRLDYGRHINRSARLVAANRSRADARRNRRPDVAAIGDAGTFLRDLAAAMHESGPWTDWRASLEVRETARDGEIGARARESTTLINPLALLREIDACAGDDATFILDGGDFAATAAYVLSPRGPLRQLDPGVFGTLGVGGGFALGAAVARPGAEIWILYGDGSAAYSLAEFDTFVRHGLAVIAVVGNDASWAQIARDQVALLEDDVGTTLRRSDYHTVARGFGGAGLMVDHPEEVPAVLAEAQRLAAAGTPVLVNALLAPSDFRKGSISM
jgi:acetolactate synthase-1/2/3 large subunit